METANTERQSSFSFWKKVIFMMLFFVVTPLTIGVTMLSIFSLDDVSDTPSVLAASTAYPGTETGVKVFAALPDSIPSVSGQVTSTDARKEMIRQYLAERDSVLVEYSDYIVDTADKYEIDYRLLVAIARKESNLCKRIPPGGHNCWGWGIHSKGTLGFDSYEESIEAVSKGLRESYYDLGYITVDEIMDKWVPHSPEREWSTHVSLFMSEME